MRSIGLIGYITVLVFLALGTVTALLGPVPNVLRKIVYAGRRDDCFTTFTQKLYRRRSERTAERDTPESRSNERVVVCESETLSSGLRLVRRFTEWSSRHFE